MSNMRMEVALVACHATKFSYDNNRFNICSR